MPKPLHLTVAGHTNVGKTSLLRTLGRDANFGRVENAPNITRNVEALALKAGDEELIVLYDTPGLEDAMALREFIDDLAEEQQLPHWDGPAKVAAFINTTRAKTDFEQEAKVLGQLLQSDAVLFVLDVRQDVLTKYLDELALLQLCGKPVLPVLNFTASSESQEEVWREELRKAGLHLIISFDSVTPPFAGEAKLYDFLGNLLNGYQEVLQRWQEQLLLLQKERWKTASECVADLIISAAAYRNVIDASEQEKGLKTLRAAVFKAEQKTKKDLLALFEFEKTEVLGYEEFPAEASWERDLFHPATIKRLGITASQGVAAGAAAGASFDLITGGLSLGMGTVVGAGVAGGAQIWRKLGYRIKERTSGQRALVVDDALLRALILRQYELITLLSRRGHGAQGPLTLPKSAEQAWQKASMPKPIKEARNHPNWCAWGKLYNPYSAKRQQKKMALAAILQEQFAEVALFIAG
ncbi:MAG TPA: GTPase/DUF3482 domain-containing protein [Alcanivoracaceae bacterium]|nr:GTPase/DUF3482 domain-containing protein [Alcanivoracaceae bacterium]